MIKKKSYINILRKEKKLHLWNKNRNYIFKKERKQRNSPQMGLRKRGCGTERTVDDVLTNKGMKNPINSRLRWVLSNPPHPPYCPAPSPHPSPTAGQWRNSSGVEGAAGNKIKSKKEPKNRQHIPTKGEDTTMHENWVLEQLAEREDSLTASKLWVSAKNTKWAAKGLKGLCSSKQVLENLRNNSTYLIKTLPGQSWGKGSKQLLGRESKLMRLWQKCPGYKMV